MANRALVVVAPSSGAGKTIVTLGLLRALTEAGIKAVGAKSGPDFIDPAFHRVASGCPSINLDAWAMDRSTLAARAAERDGDLLVIEGAVGALDGAGEGAAGSALDLAAALNAPVLMVVDAAKTGASAALAPAGLRALRPEVTLLGVVLNRVARCRALA
ncbi:MAG: AAA family ATPase, partial [Pseudomonadota bacterium]